MYMGAFRPTTSGLDAENGLGDCAYRSSSDSLFCLVGPYGQKVIEVSIPAPYAGSNIGSMLTSTTLQPSRDAFEGNIALISSLPGTQKYGDGIAISGTTLVISAFEGYGPATASHFTRSTTIATTTVNGPWKMTQATGPTLDPSFTTGSMAEIPVSHRSKFGGKTHIGGTGSLSVVSRTSYGPSLHAFNLADFVAGGNASSVPLAWYSEQPSICPVSLTCLLTLGSDVAWYADSSHLPNAANYALWLNPDNIGAIVIPEGYDTVLVFGTHSSSNFCYGVGGPYVGNNPASSDRYEKYPPNTTIQAGDIDEGVGGEDIGDKRCYDPAGTAKGEHAYPYEAWVWAYDINDLADAYAGIVSPYDVMPYESVKLPGLETFTFGGHAGILGGGYDAAGKRIFLTGPYRQVGVATWRLIHVMTHP
jgi:hypothetical protein